MRSAMRCPWMHWGCPAIVAAGLCVGSAFGGEPTGSLTVPTEWGSNGTLDTAPPREVPLLSRAPRGVTPPKTEDAVGFAEVPFAAGDGLLLAVAADGPAPRLWIDRDGDRDLSDETARTFDRAYERHTAATTQAWYLDSAAPQPATIDIVLATGGTPRLQITARLARHGWVDLAGRRRGFALVDADTDLAFGTEGVDGILLDVDGDGWLTRGVRGHEFFVLGAPFRVGNEGWVARVPAASGATVRFERSPTVPAARPYRFDDAAPAPSGTVPAPAPADLEQLLRRLDAVPHQDSVARRVRIAELGRLGDPAAFETLLGIAETDTDEDVRRQAVFSMGHPALGDLAVGYLESLLRRGDRWIGPAAAAALHAHGGRDAERLLTWAATQGLPSVRPFAARYLALLGTETARKQALHQFHESQSFVVREQSYAGLRVLPGGPPAVTVRQAAASKSGAIWKPALQDLALLGHPDAAALARGGIARESVSPAVLETLIRVLGAEPGAENVEALFAVAGRVGLKTLATERLAEVRAEDAVAALLGGLEAPARAVRLMAATALEHVPGDPVREGLVAAVAKESDPDVMVRLVRALGKHRDDEALRALLQATRHRNPGVRRTALAVLARTRPGRDRVRQLLANRLRGGASDAEAILALDALAAAKDQRTPRLALPEIDAETRALRLAALQALARVPSSLAIDPLIRRLEREDDALTRLAIARALVASTEVDHGLDAARWRAWRKGSESLPPQPVVPPSEDRERTDDSRWVRPESYLGIPLWTRNATIVLDASGPRMHGDLRWPRRLAGIRRAHRRFNDTVVRRLGIGELRFDDAADPWRDRVTQKARAGTTLSHDPRPGLGDVPTNLAAALKKAFEDQALATVVIVSDGNPARGARRSTEEFLAWVRALNDTRRVVIHVLSVGEDSDLMRRLAAENWGEYRVLPGG